MTGNPRGPYSYKSAVAMVRGREYKGRDLIDGMKNADLRAPQDSPFLPYENSGEIVGFDPNKSSSVFGKPDTPPSSSRPDKKAGKRTKKTRKSKKSRKRIKSKKNRKSKKNNKSRKRKRISKMPMELPRELKTTGGFVNLVSVGFQGRFQKQFTITF